MMPLDNRLSRSTPSPFLSLPRRATSSERSPFSLCFCLLCSFLGPFFHRGRSEKNWLIPFQEIMKPAKGKGTPKKESKKALKAVDDRKAGKRKAATKADKSSKKTKTIKDPNKPKRAPSAFFVFLEDFRKTFKKDNPNLKAVSAVGKAAGEKWRNMSDSEKAPYEAKAAKKKAEYEKLMSAYNKKQDNTAHDGDGESEHSESEVHDEVEEETAEGEEEDDGEEEDEDDE